ncbi:hypothetical protein N1851_030045 [Merluccius polli]|uniref:Uncharacterized protein n=1 Tax=Merluccius polli TaxID=89951 RepID=A0AA47NR91_MERPO|nr:hypothetical protein N1851_030045 [Merluccius polli]
MLVKQQLLSSLPQGTIPPFDGQVLEYKSFIHSFEHMIERKTDNNRDRLQFLIQYTKGQAQRLVKSCEYMSADRGYQRAKELLKENFGNEYKISCAYLEKVLSWTPMKSDDPNMLQDYAMFLRSCCNAMEEMEYMQELDTISNMRSIALKLPYKLREKWRNKAYELQEQHRRRARILDLVSYIEKQARIAADPVFGDLQDQSAIRVKARSLVKSHPPKSSGSSYAASISLAQKETKPEPSCPLCSSKHVLDLCKEFAKKPHRDKLSFIKTKGICFGCLSIGHISKECKKRLSCVVCKQAHPSTLHIEIKGKATKEAEKPSGVIGSASAELCGHIGAGDQECALPIVPVKVKAAKGSKALQVYALLDPGSSATFCSEELMTHLNLKGRKTHILLRTMNQEKSVPTHVVSGIEVSALDSDDFLPLPDTFAQKEMPVTSNNIPRQEDLAQWAYLSKVKIPSICSKVELLIGTNAPNLIEPWEVVNSQSGGPYAARTLLGWVVNGPLRNGTGSVKSVTVNRISVARLEELLISQYNQDFSEVASEEKTEMSIEDKRFLEMANKAVLNDGHYNLKLPFRKTDLQNSGVYHPKKKKLRVVFDCAASYQGLSLNTKLLQGPDLTNSLIGVILRFRKEPVGIMSDIKSMFHQVRVAKSDVNCLRFLWWPQGDTSQAPKEHRMLVHIFGAVSSPSIATFALQKTASDNQTCFPPQVAETIQHNFYVDDCAKSVAKESDAIQLVKDLTALCSKGGFQLTQWVSNRRTVLASIPKEHRAKDIKTLDLDKDRLPIERALGLQWCVDSDNFQFNISLSQKPHTRRGILSVISSIFDPLGFLAPLILPAKQLLQELCQRGFGWDEPLPQPVSEKWMEWTSSLERIKGFNVPRCLKPKDYGVASRAELHHFSDASESGYGAVSYIRQVNKQEVVHDDPEVRRSAAVLTAVVNTETPTDQLISFFSDWMRLLKAVAWYLKLKRFLMLMVKRGKESPSYQISTRSNRKKVSIKNEDFRTLTVKDLEEAERSVITYTQRKAFPAEITTLEMTPPRVHKSSRICKLDPVLDEGILRVGGRLHKSAMPEETKHPCILPKDSHMSILLSRHIHERCGHSGRNHMLSELRKRYWIEKSNSVARKVLSRCVVCRRMRGKAGEQKMADLPLERIQPDLPPFTNVGLDYFGPIEVRRGRSTIKRYGVLFTCMSSRAVHLEIAFSLDTDSCIHALRRFVCRRGQVKHIRSDNGTNLVGAQAELKKALMSLNERKIQDALLPDGIEWSFNPPAASHHGGVWERLIRSVRQVLNSTLHQQSIDDEGLQTLFCEVEAILNNRPLSTVSSDPHDLEPLTPNHILLLKAKPVLLPGTFLKSDIYARRRWKQVQYMADLFWHRWTKEYLLLLQERQKWTAVKKNMNVGDIVLVIDPTAPRGSWPLARVLETKPDARGLVRSVKVQTKTSVLERPITKLCQILESEE